MITWGEPMFSGLMAKFYLLMGAGLIATYFTWEVRGTVFSGTDARPSLSSGQSSGGRSGRSGGGGVFFWGSGYRGGK